jgi:hypothetical protein
VLKRRQSAGNSPSIARALPIVPPPGTSTPSRPINNLIYSHVYIN